MNPRSAESRHSPTDASHRATGRMAPAEGAQLAQMMRLLGRLLRVPAVAVVTDRRIIARGLEPQHAHSLSNLASLVPSHGVVSISNLGAMPAWSRGQIPDEGLRFLAGTGLRTVGGVRATLLVLDSRLRGPLIYTERIALEEFGLLFAGLLDMELEPEGGVVPGARVFHGASSLQPERLRPHENQPEDAFQSDATLEDAKQQAINDERLRIARELHDGFGKELFGLAMLLESVAETQKGRAVQDDLLKYAEAARRLGNDGRALLRTFRESGRTGFSEHLQAIIEPFQLGQTQPDGLHIHVVLPEHLPEFDQAATHELSRVLQEALENVRRHARAKNAWVTVNLQDSSFLLRIDDDGRGIDGLASSGRYGLIGMNERVELLGGQLLLESSPRGGTRVEARVPLTTLLEDHDVNRS